ncbi:cupin domain-containing protein [Streptomyces lutosisoli]|uniref:Cupin domain-containing protein n=1 Tax=Streptomyces lutosisoli TaxID=2665721 RepID=A0ABW2VTH8_9ACTN
MGAMTDGLVLPPGSGRRMGTSGMTLKVGAEHSAPWSVFEAEVGPGFDVGAHFHDEAEELFYIVDGELDLLAFEPRIRTAGDWQTWESESGQKVVRGGPGSLMYVPSGCPHGFANPGSTPARMLFLAAPAGHEHYIQEIADILDAPGPPDVAAIAQVRSRHGIHQLTQMKPGQ